MRSVVALLLILALAVQAQDQAVKIHARLEKLPANAEIEVRLQNGNRIRGHVKSFDQTELVLAEHPNPIALSEVKSLKEVKPPRQGPSWNPATGFLSWKAAIVVGALFVGLIVLVKTNTR